MLHIKTKHLPTYKLFSSYCMVKDVRATITRQSSKQKTLLSVIKAIAKGTHTEKQTKTLRESGADIDMITAVAATYPHGKTFVVPQPSKTGIDVGFTFDDSADARAEKKKRFWHVLAKHYFACDVTRIPEKQKFPVINGLGEVVVVERSGNTLSLGDLTFEIDVSYKPPIPKVVLASTTAADFHEHPRAKTGGCHRDCQRKCDFSKFEECLELFIVPMLMKAVTLRQKFPNRKDVFHHTQAAIAYIIQHAPRAQALVTPHPLVSLCLMLMEPDLVNEQVRAGILVDDHITTPAQPVAP
jgi:hypothetical protein